ncbi:MAG: mandelate racemase/muconate lactonizing enzyme family protein [Dysosmobacter sp.]|jgi:gluconate/galactonate dehydratase|uniref:mandelate racemase/muconate lactonizing enzyme family protein n=1 Tax=Dysosmobacter sp. TaxID=2591382 RepID=UPI00262D119F|nr:mandelate racemase/muconate lactonizing enzyme family protein [Dysosmobacter sp.]
MEKNHLYEEALQNVRRSSCPSDLKIVDMKVCDLEPPFSATIIKLITNQGLEGYGQVREGGSRVYALMLKRLLLGENPCNVDKIFRRIKQFGYHSHQAGGVSGVEMALWDLAGKAYGVPAYQLLGGKFRDQIRVYCDTDIDGKPDGKRMGAVLKERIEKKGYTIMKMDLSIMELLYDVEGALTYPTGELKEYMESLHGAFGYHGVTAYDPKLSREEQLEAYARRNNLMKRDDIPGPSRGIHITELGLDILEQYVKDVRDVVGYQIPIAVDHFGPIGVGDCIRLGNRLEKYNMAWLEDMVPWMMTDQLAEISRNVRTPLCTGEDIYLKENFKPLLEKRAVSIIHPDIASVGGLLEMKKVGDLAQEYGVPMAIHMNETPICAMAAMQVAAATENFFAQEFHHNDYPFWSDFVVTRDNPIIQNGFIRVPDDPGLGILALNDEVLAEHLHVVNKDKVWHDTDEWDDWYAFDRLWL